MFKRIDHVALVTKNLQKSLKFYEGLLGFQQYYEHDVPFPAVEKIVYLKLGDTILEFIHMPNAEIKENMGFHFCLESDNFDEDYHRLVASGIVFTSEPHIAGAREPGEETWKRAVFYGPDKEQIEIRG